MNGNTTPTVEPTYVVLDPPAGYKDFKRLRNYLDEWTDPPYPPTPAQPTPVGSSRRATVIDNAGMLTNNCWRTL